MRLAELDDAAFDAAFGPLDICGRDPAHWRMLEAAVAEDLRPGPLSAAERAAAGLAVEPPARLRPPRAARRWPRVAGAGVVLALAAGLLLRVATPEHGDPAQLVPRGLAPTADGAAALDVQVAVRPASGGDAVRYDPAAAARVGDTLYVEVQLGAPGAVELRRASGAVLWRGDLPAGRALLPVGYALEAADAGARLVVEADGRQAVILVGAVRSAP